MAIRNLISPAKEPNAQLETLARSGPDQDNIAWLVEAWHQLDANDVFGSMACDCTRLLLVGGSSISHVRLRFAQSAIRQDRTPSHFSHVALIECGPISAATKVFEISLDGHDDRNYPPRNNAVQVERLEKYGDPVEFPNVAVLVLPVPWRLVEENIQRFRLQSNAIDATEMLLAWMGYAWATYDASNPLRQDMGMPSAVLVESVINPLWGDITPGLGTHAASPEAIWQAVRWWHNYPRPTLEDHERTDETGAEERGSPIASFHQGILGRYVTGHRLAGVDASDQPMPNTAPSIPAVGSDGVRTQSASEAKTSADSTRTSAIASPPKRTAVGDDASLAQSAVSATTSVEAQTSEIQSRLKPIKELADYFESLGKLELEPQDHPAPIPSDDQLSALIELLPDIGKPFKEGTTYEAVPDDHAAWRHALVQQKLQLAESYERVAEKQLVASELAGAFKDLKERIDEAKKKITSKINDIKSRDSSAEEVQGPEIPTGTAKEEDSSADIQEQLKRLHTLKTRAERAEQKIEARLTRLAGASAGWWLRARPDGKNPSRIGEISEAADTAGEAYGQRATAIREFTSAVERVDGLSDATIDQPDVLDVLKNSKLEIGLVGIGATALVYGLWLAGTLAGASIGVLEFERFLAALSLTISMAASVNFEGPISLLAGSAIIGPLLIAHWTSVRQKQVRALLQSAHDAAKRLDSDKRSLESVLKEQYRNAQSTTELTEGKASPEGSEYATPGAIRPQGRVLIPVSLTFLLIMYHRLNPWSGEQSIQKLLSALLIIGLIVAALLLKSHVFGVLRSWASSSAGPLKPAYNRMYRNAVWLLWAIPLFATALSGSAAVRDLRATALNGQEICTTGVRALSSGGSTLFMLEGGGLLVVSSNQIHAMGPGACAVLPIKEQGPCIPPPELPPWSLDPLTEELNKLNRDGLVIRHETSPVLLKMEAQPEIKHTHQVTGEVGWQVSSDQPVQVQHRVGDSAAQAITDNGTVSAVISHVLAFDQKSRLELSGRLGIKDSSGPRQDNDNPGQRSTSFELWQACFETARTKRSFLQRTGVNVGNGFAGFKSDVDECLNELRDDPSNGSQPGDKS